MSWTRDVNQTEVRATSRRLAFAVLLVTACASTPGWAQDNTELAKKTQNPVADLISVPFRTMSTSGSARTTTSSTS
jgi:hypothetical protein